MSERICPIIVVYPRILSRNQRTPGETLKSILGLKIHAFPPYLGSHSLAGVTIDQ